MVNLYFYCLKFEYHHRCRTETTNKLSKQKSEELGHLDVEFSLDGSGWGFALNSFVYRQKQLLRGALLQTKNSLHVPSLPNSLLHRLVAQKYLYSFGL